MVMRWEYEVQVQDVRNHSQELVQRLETLLLRGASLLPDPRHPGFFEIQNEEQVYYVHVVPHTGKVLLLATWSHTHELASTCGVA
jgi:hypothetical protein